jgi:hypothetical protein
MVQRRVALLFGDAVTQRRLAETRERLDSVPVQDLDALSRTLTQSWTTRFEDLLEERREAAEALRQLLDDLVRSPGQR